MKVPSLTPSLKMAQKKQGSIIDEHNHTIVTMKFPATLAENDHGGCFVLLTSLGSFSKAFYNYLLLAQVCLLFFNSSIDSFHAFYFPTIQVLKLLKELSAHTVLTHFKSYIPGLTIQVYFMMEQVVFRIDIVSLGETMV